MASDDTQLHRYAQQGELTPRPIATAIPGLATAKSPDILDADYAEAERFLLALDPDPNAVWCFRTFSDRVKGKGRNRTGTLAKCWRDLVRDNANQRGVFVIPNEGGHKDLHITRARAVWIDLDGPPLEPALAEVRDKVPGLEPGIVVDSSPAKWHPYWPIDPADPLPIGEFRALQLRLIEITGSEQTDRYDGEVLRVSVLTLSDVCGEAQGGVMMRLQMMGGDPADMQCYAVLSVTGDRMELSYLPRGNTLTFIRP
jgi:hypothetical protein